MTICCIGDIHGHFDRLATIVMYYKPDCVFVVGDFGWFPELNPLFIPWHVTNTCKIYFIDGNHEDHKSLRDHANTREPVELYHNLFYLPRGTVISLPDGRRVLCAGGAKSIDWAMRTRGFDWFPEEILDRRDLPDQLPKVDIVLSHTVPASIFPRDFSGPIDPSCYVLDEILDACKPNLWIAGHFHQRETYVQNDCTFHILQDVREFYCKPSIPDYCYVLSGTLTFEASSGWMLPSGNFLPGCEKGATIDDARTYFSCDTRFWSKYISKKEIERRLTNLWKEYEKFALIRSIENS